MTTCITEFGETSTGYAFEVHDHRLMIDWAKRHDHRAVVRLDHGVAGEEYEEVVELRFGVSNRCRFIIWRTAQAVFVQPLIGRRKRYASVGEALEGSLLTREHRCHSVA
jgi:hypothetical protein